MNARSKPLWWASEVAEATQTTVSKNCAISGLSIDTRSLEPGDLFIALKGPQHDGHAFVGKALDLGASAALVHHIPEELKDDARLIYVPDTMEALNQLGRAGRKRSRACIIAITGSVGKTGTKEALRCVCEKFGRTHASVASFNNHFGVPLSLARMPRDTEYGIFELGMNHPGELSTLSHLVEPHIALITTIAPAHMAAFETLEDVARAKCEIFEGLVRDGTAILNNLSPEFAFMMGQLDSLGIRRRVIAGPGGDIFMRDLPQMADGQFVISDGHEECVVRLQVAGKHWHVNALNVAACSLAAGIPIGQLGPGLSSFTLPPGRGRLLTASLSTGGKANVIDDSYNANPASMQSALDVLGEVSGRRVAVLGEMREMGQHSERLHRDLGQMILDCGLDSVILVGEEMSPTYSRIRSDMPVVHVMQESEVDVHLENCLQDQDTLLVKGSNGVKLGRLVERLVHAQADSKVSEGVG